MEDEQKPQTSGGVATMARPNSGISVSPSDVLKNMQQLYAQMIGDLTYEVCVRQAALEKSEVEKADALDRLATANARLARRAS